ncbi:MAG: hypothetical protein WD533_04130 [Dehalococcoidia bacterium]
MAGASAGGAAAAAAAAAAAHARRLLVGGLLIEVPANEFQRLASQLNGLVVTGTIGSFWSKERIYLTPYNGMTFYCKTQTDERLPVSAVEVPHIDKGPLKL